MTKVVTGEFLIWLMAPDFKLDFIVKGSGTNQTGIFHQSGVALISILLLLTVLATLAIYTAENQDLAIRRVENQSVAEQGYQVNLSGEQWVVKVLERDIQTDLENAESGQPVFDHYGEIWGNLGPPVEVGETGTTLLMSIEDLQGKLNINNLIVDSAIVGGAVDDDTPKDALWLEIFRNLTFILEHNPELVDGMVDWVDSDQNPIGTTGAEDLYYTGLEVPYRSANRAMSSTAEISRVKDFTPEVVQSLLPWVSALPLESKSTAILVNVNTAPAEILAAFSKFQPADPGALGPLIEKRQSAPFEELGDFATDYQALMPDGLVQGYATMLATTSNFYAGRSCAESGRVKFSMTSLLQKQTSEENVKVLQRERFFGCPTFTNPDPDEKTDQNNS